MSPRISRAVLFAAAGLTACGRSAPSQSPGQASALDSLPPDRRDAAILGREVFQLVDRAADYKASHRGRPPASLRQMGVESLAPLVVRRIRIVSDSSVVTVAFRQPRGRNVASCEGTAQVLEEATLSGGTFSVVCETASGAVARYKVPLP